MTIESKADMEEIAALEKRIGDIERAMWKLAAERDECKHRIYLIKGQEEMI